MKNLIFPIFLLILNTSIYSQSDCNILYPTISQNGKYIYFSSTLESDNYQIYRSDINGENITRLTYSEDNDFYPDESPDGKWLTFQRGDYNEGAEIYILHLNTMQLSKLTDNNVYDGQPKFSPDSYKIAFCAWDDSPYPEIFTMNIDGSNRTQITADPDVTHHSKPVYSPDGNYIYFAYGENADNRIIKMTSDGSTWTDITLPNDFGYDESYFDIFENGEKLVIQTTEYHGYNRGTDIILINSDGSGWTKLTAGDDYEYFYTPCLNPNNSDFKIYFSYCKNIKTNSHFNLKSMSYDGNNISTIKECKTLTNEELPDQPAKWIYPNPACCFLNISNDIPENITTLLIYNSVGQLIKKVLLDNYKTKVIDISALKKGMYFVEYWDTKNKHLIEKFIVY